MTNFNQKAKILKTLNFRLYIYIFVYVYIYNAFSSKPDSETLQHEVLPDNCKIENLRDMLRQTAAKNVSFFYS